MEIVTLLPRVMYSSLSADASVVSVVASNRNDMIDSTTRVRVKALLLKMVTPGFCLVLPNRTSNVCRCVLLTSYRQSFRIWGSSYVEAAHNVSI
jgi:hypothetical protein